MNPLELLHARIGDFGVLTRSSNASSGNPLRYSNPASLTWLALSSRYWSWANPLRCFSPASLTLVPLRTESELGQSFEVFQPGIADLGAAEVQIWSRVNPLRCSSPASLTFVSRGRALEVGSIL